MYRLVIVHKCENPMCNKVHALAIDAADGDLDKTKALDLTHPETVDDLARVLESEGIKPMNVIAMHIIPLNEDINPALLAYAEVKKIPIKITPLVIS